jgi:hypothetical protein
MAEEHRKEKGTFVWVSVAHKLHRIDLKLIRPDGAMVYNSYQPIE